MASSSFEILVRGEVQGVGFRPAVYKIARSLNICGEIANTHEGVKIACEFSSETPEADLRNFCERIREKGFCIENFLTRPVPLKGMREFKIMESKAGKTSFSVPRDRGICNDCLKDWSGEGNRRQGYAFVSCALCGVRFTGMREIPYERKNLTIAEFSQCEVCRKEYADPTNRRFHAQTNTCPNCGPKVFWEDTKGNQTTENAVKKAAKILFRQGIVAVKGIGGFLFVCNAKSDVAVQRLRKWKGRPSKPFAVLFWDESAIKECFETSTDDLALLRSPERPIVLLQKKTAGYLLSKEISPGLSREGCFLPASGLLAELCKNFPLVATSANVSGEPLHYDGEILRTRFSAKLDGILDHDLEIYFPLDDSLTDQTESGRKIILRNARGFAPVSIPSGFKMPETLATGAQEKSSFALHTNGMLYSSGYLGDLENYDVQVRFEQTVEKFCRLLNFSPRKIAVDLHPEYFGTLFGKKLAEQKNLPVFPVQHHRAHFACVLHENGLLHSKEPVLGWIWDGSGFGEDGAVWGGECFRYYDGEFERLTHLSYVPLLSGEQMIRFPKIAALAFANLETAEIRKAFSEQEYLWWEKQKRKPDGWRTSSMGRFFDAVSFVLTGIGKNEYNGHAAMHLENLARSYFRKNIAFPEIFPFGEGLKMDGEVLFRNLLAEKQAGKNSEFLAAKFHYTLVRRIQDISRELGAKKLCFSGGVFQNSILNDLLEKDLRDSFDLFFHVRHSPNDDSIAPGQIVCAALAAE